MLKSGEPNNPWFIPLPSCKFIGPTVLINTQCESLTYIWGTSCKRMMDPCNVDHHTCIAIPYGQGVHHGCEGACTHLLLCTSVDPIPAVLHGKLFVQYFRQRNRASVGSPSECIEVPLKPLAARACIPEALSRWFTSSCISCWSSCLTLCEIATPILLRTSVAHESCTTNTTSISNWKRRINFAWFCLPYNPLAC